MLTRRFRSYHVVALSSPRYGFSRQILTDHGSQFTKVHYDAEGHFDAELRGLEEERGIAVQHIRSRVRHPQTGGKVERLFGTIKSKLKARWPDGKKEFRSLDEIVRWYNEVKPHESLDFDHAGSPAEAFVRKLRPKERKAYLKRLRVWRLEFLHSRLGSEHSIA